MIRPFLLQVAWLCFGCSLCAAPFVEMTIPWQDHVNYEATTQRFLKLYSYQKIDAALKKQGVALRQKPFFDLVALQEEEGHIGYTASSHHFRVFQDIIRIVLEEILELEFKKDFYFFRLPGDPHVYDFLSGVDFIAHHPTLDDNFAPQRDQLISMNFTVFSNFAERFECTAVFFENAISYLPPNFKKKIGYLFDSLGIPHEHILPLFNLSRMMHHYQAGTLFQFFDLSYQTPYYKKAYEFIDLFAYPAVKRGAWLSNMTDSFSNLFQDLSKTHFNHQYRLVVNHSELLNPYSSLYIRRYDLNNPLTVRTYENKLRTLIKQLPFDPTKALEYKHKLLAYWGVSSQPF